MAKRKNLEKPHEDHMDEAWLLPYADLLTLLLALFIVLFASAQVDQKKLDMMSEAFSKAFGAGSVSVLESTRTPPNITEGQPTKQNDSVKDKNLEAVQLAKVKLALDKYIIANKLAGRLETAIGSEGLLIRIKDSALFPSGSAALIPESQSFAGEIAKLLAGMPQNVVISGHTDNVPINTAEFPTNWHLSSQRALNFMICILAKDNSLKPERFSAIGFGEYRPLTDNNSEEGRAINRRVEILIVRKNM